MGHKGYPGKGALKERSAALRAEPALTFTLMAHQGGGLDLIGFLKTEN